MTSRIGELVVERGLATAAQVHAAVQASRRQGLPLASSLLRAGVDEGALAAILAELHGVPGVDLSRTTIELAAIDVVPRAVAEADLILPISLEGNRVHLAMAHPLDERILSELRFVTGREVSPYVAVHVALARAIAGAYDARARGEERWSGAAAEGPLAVASAAPPAAEGATPLDASELLEELPADEIAIEVEPEPVEARGDGQPLVLVVDDEPEIRTLLARVLAARGYAVETAADGAEALARAEAIRPDVVLLDAMLPRVHGFEACRRLRASARTRAAPVLMMTAVYRGWRFAQDARESYGAADYVEKPFHLDDLLRRIEQARTDAAGARRAAAAPPVDPRVARGRELLTAGRLDEAAAVLAEAAGADPFSAEAHLQLGRALRAKGDGFGAMTALERGVELRPAHLPALRALAALYEEKGFRRKAAEVLERALPAAGEGEARAALREDLLRLLG